MTRKNLATRMLEAGIWAKTEVSNTQPPDGFDSGSSSWKVTLRRHRSAARLTVPFYMGSAHTEAPSAEDVLDCLLSDASLVENSRDFADFASELGYDTDSRKAEHTYRQTVTQTEKLKRFLGDDYKDFVWETERL